MTVMLRQASAIDADALTACFAAAYAPYSDIGLPAVTEGLADDIRDHHVWVALVDGKVMGGIVLVLSDHAHIANLAVDPDAGGQGIGKSLIDRAIGTARAAGYARIDLTTHTMMEATQAYYQRLGWTETGRDGHKVYFAKQLH